MLKFNITCFRIFLLVIAFAEIAKAQDFVLPVADYSFENNQVVDKTGNTELSLRNGTVLFDDQQRGKVLRFSSAKKSYAVLNKQILNSDSCSISFFFYWETEGATSWHQVFEIHNAKTGSNLYFTPQNGWGSNQCSLISDSKEYGNYENVDARQLSKNTWMHIAVTFNGKLTSGYINGQLASSGNTMFTPNLIYGDSLYLGGNPKRSNNYYITARLDDIKIFDVALTANQIQSVFKGEEIPEPVGSETVWETTGTPVQLKIDLEAKKQTIQNFGSSDAWNTERIGKYWPAAKKEKLAELLFSNEKDVNGNPYGIGLSAWRFNIGAGTAEKGAASRISNESRRTEGFLNSDGISYNWNKQGGQQWFLKEAVQKYNVHHVIGWVNSPPVNYTQKNLGFRDYGTPVATILKAEYFDEYANFLADVAAHFNAEGIHFDYISPLNEPQWDWSPSTSGGTVDQEGSPWTNQEIHDIAAAIDNEFSSRNMDTKIFVTEAGSIANMLRGTGHADNQLIRFWNVNSPLSLVGKASFSNIVSYHSYWSDYGNLLVDERNSIYNNAQLLNPVPELWQTEYSLLGSGYREGYPGNKKLSEMESALSLVKIIMADLNIANTTGWQWWTTFERGKHDGESRFSLIEAFTNNNNTDGEYHVNKLFYSLGNFSHFIRPGMIRIGTTRSDNLTPNEELKDVVFSAYINSEKNKLVVLAVNFTAEPREVECSFENSSNLSINNPSLFLTNEFSNLQKQNTGLLPGGFVVPARSVVTYSANLAIGTSGSAEIEKSKFNAFHDNLNYEIVATFSIDENIHTIRLFNISGNLLLIKPVESGQNKVVFSSSHLPDGVYIVVGEGNNLKETKKVIITKR
jgi:O-glycosyl hydrolase